MKPRPADTPNTRQVGDAAFAERARTVRALVSDFDGVLTDGRLLVGPGGQEWKSICFRDVMGMARLRRCEYRTAIISGEQAPALDVFCDKTSVDAMRGNVRRKAEALAEVCAELGVTSDEVCYVGDDVNDLPALQCAHLPVVVANADPQLLAGPWWQTQTPGGAGAIREVVVALLAARGYDLAQPPANGEPVGD